MRSPSSTRSGRHPATGHTSMSGGTRGARRGKSPSRPASVNPDGPIDPSALPLTHLAMFLGLRVNELIVERGRAAGFRQFRESHGFVIQHLIESERTITELANRM